MAYFRKKPVVIEAVKFLSMGNPGEVKIDGLPPKWLTEAHAKHPDEPGSISPCEWEPEALLIKTLEGDHMCSPGDWIVRGVEGELYPVKPGIFAKTYEPAE